MRVKPMIPESRSKKVFGQSRKRPEMLRAWLYARVAKLDWQIARMNLVVMRESERGTWPSDPILLGRE